FRYSAQKPVIISGHRGGMLPGYPENSIETMEKTLTVLPSYFEIDVQYTKDSVLILMHDFTLDRTTNFTGRVIDYTYEELKKARLKDRYGQLTDARIPTLEEVLDWGRDKTIFQLDNKKVRYEDLAALIKRKQYPNIMFGVDDIEEMKYYYQEIGEVMFCIGLKTNADLDRFLDSGVPADRIIAMVGATMVAEKEPLYARLRNLGIMCFIAIAPTHDKNNDELQRLKAYCEELIKGPDIIETDFPTSFVQGNNNPKFWLI